MLKRPAIYVRSGQTLLAGYSNLTIPIFTTVEWLKKMGFSNSSPQMFTTESPVKLNSKNAKIRWRLGDTLGSVPVW